MPTTEENKYAPTTWGGSTGEDLTVPSGQLCKVRRPGPTALINEGVLHSMDQLTAIVDAYVTEVEGKPKVNVDSLMKQPSKIIEMIHIVDKVVCATVIEPKVHMTPNDSTSRQNGVIYTDMIDIEDRFFIFQFVMGGSNDLKRFREESEELVGDVPAVAEDVHPSLRGHLRKRPASGVEL